MDDLNIDLEDNSDEISEKVNSLDDYIRIRQGEWNQTLSPLTQLLRSNNPDDMNNVQADSLSNFLDITSEEAEFNLMLIKYQSSKASAQRDKFLHYTIDFKDSHGKNLNIGEKKVMIDGDLADLNMQIQLLQSHISFLQDCKQMLTNIQFAIKNKLQIMNL